MDIIIKSFNRPFYLDRCIYSIYKYLSGNFTIKVLDDGTPEKYLQRIQQKYSEVIIYKSENYSKKIKTIEENLQKGSDINGFQIPTQLWIDTVKKATPYFIMTEDDVWFTDFIDVSEIEENMEEFNIFLLKLGWLGSHDNFKSKQISNQVFAQLPNLFTAPKFIMRLFFFNKFKFFSLLFRLKIVDNNTIGKYWALNSILMGMYKKEYWLQIWEGADGKVDELLQLCNASLYYRKNKSNKNFICRLGHEVMRTTFSSSATNSYHNYKDINLDINQVNHILNEKWLDDEFDIIENFPKDYSEGYILDFLKKENNPKAAPEEWKKWIALFKQQYINIGCEIE